VEGLLVHGRLGDGLLGLYLPGLYLLGLYLLGLLLDHLELLGRVALENLLRLVHLPWIQAREAFGLLVARRHLLLHDLWVLGTLTSWDLCLWRLDIRVLHLALENTSLLHRRWFIGTRGGSWSKRGQLLRFHGVWGWRHRVGHEHRRWCLCVRHARCSVLSRSYSMMYKTLRLFTLFDLFQVAEDVFARQG
jgi:hypothetical protein